MVNKHHREEKKKTVHVLTVVHKYCVFITIKIQNYPQHAQNLLTKTSE